MNLMKLGSTSSVLLLKFVLKFSSSLRMMLLRVAESRNSVWPRQQTKVKAKPPQKSRMFCLAPGLGAQVPCAPATQRLLERAP